jgi:hypothetical protein
MLFSLVLTLHACRFWLGPCRYSQYTCIQHTTEGRRSDLFNVFVGVEPDMTAPLTYIVSMSHAVIWHCRCHDRLFLPSLLSHLPRISIEYLSHNILAYPLSSPPLQSSLCRGI